MSRGGRYFLLIADENSPPDSVAVISKALSDTVIAADFDFPQSSVIDDFNRGDGALGANWTGDPLNESAETFVISSNQMFVNTGSPAGAYWSAATFGPNCEAYCTMVDASSGLATISLLLRLQSPGQAGVDGYQVEFDCSGNTVVAKRISGGGALGSSETIPAPADGDKVGAAVVGTTVIAYYKDGAAAWAEVGRWTDGNVSSAGNAGVRVEYAPTSVTLDDFGAGSITGGSQFGLSADKALADSAVATEALSVLVELALADSGVATEALTLAVALALADSAVASELMTRVMAFAREFSDTAGATEAITERELGRELADSLVASQASVTLHPNKVLEEAPVATEVLSRVVTFVRTFTDTPVATEAPAKALTLAAWSDSLTAGDALTWHFMMQAIDEALTAAETMTREAGLVLADNPVATEVLTAALTLAAFADSVAVAEAAALHPGLALADGAAGGEAISSVAPAQALADTALAGDEITAFEISAALADTAVATEALAKALTLAAFADGASAGDDLSASLGLVQALADSAGVADALTLAVALALADKPAASEALAKAVEKALADGAAGGETLTPLAGQVLTDTAVATDAIATFVVSAVLADAAAATEALTKALSMALADGATASEALAKAVALAAFADGVSVADAVTLEPNIGLTLTMAIVASDAATMQVDKALADVVVAAFAAPAATELPGIRLKLWGDAEGRGVGEVLRLCEGDTLPILIFRLADADDGLYDLASATVTFRMWPREETTYTVDAAATVLADSGWVEYRLQAADTATAGEYRAHLVIASGGREFVSETFLVRIRQML